jgi:hypothetical protein
MEFSGKELTKKSRRIILCENILAKNFPKKERKNFVPDVESIESRKI